MHILLALLGLGGLVLAFWLPAFRDAEGFLDPTVCLLFSLATAAFLLAAAWRTPLRQAAAWFALVIAGQGLALQLIDAGTSVRYQHYRPVLETWSVPELLVLTLLVLQGLLAFAASRTRIGSILGWIRTHTGISGALLIGCLMVVLGTFPSRELPLFATELVFSGMLILIQFTCLLLGLMSIPGQALSNWGNYLGRFLAHTPEGTGAAIDRVALLGAVWVTCITVLLVTFSYERHPHIPDEFAYLFHANYFSEGRLATPAPPVNEAVEAYLMDCDDNRCISPVPPGWPAVLALGSAAGVPWLVNPVLGGINVVLLFMLLNRLYGRGTARLGVLLVAASPWYLFMSMNFMTHTFSLTCALVAGLSVVQMHREQRSSWGIPGGIAIGLLALTRPLEGLMVASVLGLATLFIRGSYFRLGPAIVLAGTSIVTGSLTLVYNYLITGSPMDFPIMAYADRVLGPGVNALGFGPDKGVHWGGLDPFPGHGFGDVLVNALLNLNAMNIELLGWSVGSLLPLALMTATRARRGFTNPDRWMLLFILVIFAFQALYWFSGGPDFGARYYYLAVIPLVALTAQAIQNLGASFSTGSLTTSRANAAVISGVVVLSIASLTNFTPWRAIDKYHHYRGMRPDIGRLLAAGDFSNGLLLLGGEAHPDLNSALVYSAIDPYSQDPVIAWDRSEEIRQRLLQAYPDRKVWLIDGPSRTGAGYRIVAGPLAASDLLTQGDH